MLHIHWITAVFAGLAGSVLLLPEEYRIAAWVAVAVGYALVCLRATFVQTCTILGPCITRGDPGGDAIALTFDDGPGARGTPEILDLLAEHGVPAAFFCIGRNADAHPDVVRRIHAEGHLVGNHSYAHTPALTVTTTARLRRDLSRCQDAIERITGSRPRFYRPPYGLRNHGTHRATRDQDLTVVGWSAGGLDTTARPVGRLVADLEKKLGPGAIVLLHDHVADAGRAVELTRRILDLAAAKGLRLVRLDDLLGRGAR